MVTSTESLRVEFWLAEMKICVIQKDHALFVVEIPGGIQAVEFDRRSPLTPQAIGQLSGMQIVSGADCSVGRRGRSHRLLQHLG